jgi:Domain of unknown function (DUF4367)
MTEPIESRLQALAKEFQYPPTPSVAGAVLTRLQKQTPGPQRSRQLAWALIMIIVLLAGLMFVPPVRAAVLEFIQIGIVRIFPDLEPSPIPTIETPMPTPTQSALIPILETLGGKTTLESARNIVDFPIQLPTYPVDLGEPDYVFVQDAGGWMVILVWRNPQEPDQVQMSLHLIEPGSWTIEKYHPETITETEVNGSRAIWTAGEYPLLLRNNDIEFRRLIAGHVLLWEINEITYRLETDLSLEEAIKIAESISP